MLLELIKIVLFIAIFLTGSSYLIPKGILYFQEWKSKKTNKLLSASITFIAGGIFLLVYLTATAIIQHTLSLCGR